jgi:hypothetical protein
MIHRKASLFLLLEYFRSQHLKRSAVRLTTIGRWAYCVEISPNVWIALNRILARISTARVFRTKEMTHSKEDNALPAEEPLCVVWSIVESAA